MNEHIEEWKRYSKAYLRFVNYEFDRIVSDAVARQERVRIDEIEAKRREQYISMVKATNEMAKKWLAEDEITKAFISGSQWF